MPNITHAIPASVLADLRSFYGGAVEGFTDRQLSAHHYRVTTERIVVSIGRQRDVAIKSARSARESNNLSRASDEESDTASVKAAENAADVAALTRLNGVN